MMTAPMMTTAMITEAMITEAAKIQRTYRAANIGRTMANNNINNEKIMANNSSTKPKPKKKRKTDQFQQFIDSAFLAARKELWIDRCDDRH